MHRPSRVLMLALAIGPGWGNDARAQEADIKGLKLRDWQPRPMLVTKATRVEKPKFPVIDVHNHLGSGKASLTPERVRSYLAEMDAAGVQTVVNLDGGWDDSLKIGRASCRERDELA